VGGGEQAIFKAACDSRDSKPAGNVKVLRRAIRVRRIGGTLNGGPVLNGG